MDKAKIILIIAVVLSIASFSKATDIIYVDVNGPNDPGSGTFNDPFRRIQDAIDAANASDIVEIRPGIYKGQGNYGLDPNGKNITIRSIDPNDPEMIANTIIDPNSTERGFYIHSGEDANCIISGLTIKKARALTANGYNGGGIYCFTSNPTIRNCVIQDGYAEGSGGGICCDYGSATIINCTIKSNTSEYYGGGISCIFCKPVITSCTISGNTAILEGGGLDIGQSAPNILNCIIIDNNAPIGGGINCYFPGIANVINCILTANSANSVGGAVYCQFEGNAILENSVFWANSAIEGAQLGLNDKGSASVTYCDVQGGQINIYDPCGLLVWGSGNIDIDPCFASFDPNGDPNLWNLHLQSKYGRWEPNSQNWVTDSNTSLCIDAGDPNSYWNGEPWPNGKRINMGAYGGTNQASKNGNLADFDVNGVVNFTDLMEFSSKWLDEQGGIVNLDLTGGVDFRDFAIFAENWLWERQ